MRLFQPRYIHAPRDFLPIANTPICVEIGAGKGKHAILFSQNHADKTLYAIERTQEKYQAMQKLHQQMRLNHLHPIHADAIAWTVHAVYPQQIEQCFILYPNPEPHNPSQRWLNMPFFEFLLSRLADDAQLIVASNIPNYLDEAEQQLNNVWQLPYQREHIASDSARTHFEIKYLQRGEPCQQFVITKPKNYRTRFDDFLPMLGQNS